MISVIVPTYNRPHQLRMAVGSALSQEGLGPGDIEVVVVDDGSSPPLSDGALADARVRIVKLETNRGPAAARNAGLAHATRPMIALLDSDDVWLPGKLQAQVRLLQRLAETSDAATIAVAGGYYYPDRKRRRIEARIPRGADTLDVFASGCWYCPGSTLLIHRSAFDQIGPFDERLRRLEDLDWFIRFARAGGRLEVCATVDTLVAPSNLGSRATVGPSVALLEQKFGPDGPMALPASAWQSLQGYLELERAAASLADGDWVGCTRSALSSLWLKPRRRIQLEDFWSYSDQIPAEIGPLFTAMSAARQAGTSG